MDKIIKVILSIIVSLGVGVGSLILIIIIGNFLGNLIYKISTSLELIFRFDIVKYFFTGLIILIFAYLFYKTLKDFIKIA